MRVLVIVEMQESQRAAGLTVLALLSLIEVLELPSNGPVGLGTGQALGLCLALVSALYCYASHKPVSSIQRGGTFCPKCESPSFAGSVHCDKCNLCVPAYIRHSKWLNSCIGSSNSLAYLTGSLTPGAIAVTLYGRMLNSKSFAQRLSGKYALRD